MCKNNNRGRKMHLLSSYLANKHFENRMLVHRGALKLVYLFSTGSAAYFLLQGIVCHKNKRKTYVSTIQCYS